MVTIKLVPSLCFKRTRNCPGIGRKKDGSWTLEVSD